LESQTTSRNWILLPQFSRCRWLSESFLTLFRTLNDTPLFVPLRSSHGVNFPCYKSSPRFSSFESKLLRRFRPSSRSYSIKTNFCLPLNANFYVALLLFCWPCVDCAHSFTQNKCFIGHISTQYLWAETSMVSSQMNWIITSNKCLIKQNFNSEISR